MHADHAIVDEQIRRELCAEQLALVRAQQPNAHGYNAPEIPAEWILIRIAGNRLYSSTGHPVSRELTEEEIDAVFALRAYHGSDHRFISEADYWRQYATEFDLHEGHCNTDPIILLLPAEKHPSLGGKSTDQQFAHFFAPLR